MRRRLAGLRTGARRAALESVTVGFAMQLTVAVSGVLVARLLGVEDRGRLALLWIVALAAGQIATLGLPAAISYVVAGGADPRAVLAGLRRMLVLQALGGSVGAAIVLAFAIDQRDAAGLIAAGSVLLVPPVLVLWLTALAVVQGQRKYGVLQRHRLIQGLLYVALLVALTVADEDELAIVTVGWVLSMIFAGAWAWRDCVGAQPPADPSTLSPASEPPALLRFGLRSFLGTFGAVEHLMLDHLLIGLALTTEDLGLFAAAVALAGLPRFLGQSIGAVAYPEVASRTDPAEQMRILRKWVVFGLAILAPIVGGIILVVGEVIPFVFGSEFEDAVPVSRLLLLAGLFQALRRVAAEASRGLGSGVPASLAEAVMMVALLLVALPLALTHGAEGAAAGLVVAAVLGLVTLAAQLARLTIRARHPQVEHL